MLQGIFSNIKASNKSPLTKIFILRDKLDNDDDEKTWAELRSQLPKIDSQTLTKIESEIGQGNSIENVLAGRFSYKYDPQSVKQFSSIFSTSSSAKPSLTQQMVVLYQSLSFICNISTTLTNENLLDLISALNKGLHSIYAPIFTYIYVYTIQTVVNADKLKWAKTTADAALSTFMSSKHFTVDTFDVFVSLVKSILSSHQENETKDVIFTILINLVTTQRNRIDNASLQRLVEIIEKWVLNYDILALRLLWAISSTHSVDTSLLMKSLSISLISPVIPKAPKSDDPIVTVNIDHIDASPRTVKFKSDFNGEILPLPFEYYVSDNIFAILDEIIDDLNTVKESMSLADSTTIFEFLSLFDTNDEIIPLLVLLWFLGKMNNNITNMFFDKVKKSYLFKMDESDIGPILMNKFVSQMRTYAIHLFAKENYESIMAIININTNFLVFVDVMTRIIVIDPKRFRTYVNTQLCEHLSILYRLISNAQLQNPTNRQLLVARSLILFDIFELSKTGNSKLLPLLIEIANEQSLINFASLSIINSYQHLNSDSIMLIGKAMDENQEFSKCLIHHFSSYLRTNESKTSINPLIDHIIQTLDTFCDVEIVSNVIDILHTTSIDYKLSPKLADIMIRAIRCVNRKHIYTKVLTLNTMESYVGPMLALHRPTFIVLILADNSPETQELLMKSTSETQNVVNMQESRIDSMLVSYLDGNGPIYGNYKLMIDLDDDFCIKLLSKIISTATTREVLSYALSVPKLMPMIENIVFNNATFMQCPLFIGRTHQLSSKIDNSVITNGFAILFWIHIDRHIIKSSEAFEKYIITIDDRVTNKFSLMLRMEASRIFLTVESYNKFRTSRVDIAEFTRPFDSNDQKWTLICMNITNESRASVDTMIAASSSMQERHTKDFDAIKMNQKPSIVIGSTELTNIAGLIGPVSLFSRKVTVQEFENFYYNPSLIPRDCAFTTARFHMMIDNNDGLTASKELSDFIKNNNFIDCLCSKKNAEYLITNRIYSIARFIFERSSIFTSDNFDILKTLKGQKHDFCLYYNLFLLVSPHLRRGQYFKPLLFLLINPFIWKDCLKDVSKHWATVLVTNISDSMSDDIFFHTISILASVFSSIDDVCKQNIYDFISRLALHDITERSAQTLAGIIYNSSGKRAKAFIYIARIIGRKLMNFSNVITFDLFDKFLQDKDNNRENIEIFGETILALSSIFGATFHSFIPTLLKRFTENNQKENQTEIYKYLINNLENEQNISIFMICLDFGSIDEITKKVEPSNIETEGDWFSNLVMLALSSNEEKMNKIIIFLSQVVKSNTDLRHIFYLMANNKTESEMDPILTFANNIYAVATNVGQFNELFIWCAATTFFHPMTRENSRAFVDVVNSFGHNCVKGEFLKSNLVYEVFNDGKSISDKPKLDVAISASERIPKVDDDLFKMVTHTLNSLKFRASKDVVDYNNSVERTLESISKLFSTEQEILDSLNNFKVSPINTEKKTTLEDVYAKSTEYAAVFCENYDT